MARITNTEQFIARAREVHGGKYDYSQSVYVKSVEKLKISCPKHGVYIKAPNKHLGGQGCPSCTSERMSEKQLLPGSVFFERSVAAHGKRYDYSRVVVGRSRDKVEIVCKKHGPFWQIASLHWSGSGCPQCAKTEGPNKKRKDLNFYLGRSKEVHGDRYTYLPESYAGWKERVSIVCSEHGAFEQVAYKHARGAGCNKCACIDRGSRKRINKEEFVRRARKTHGNRYDYSAAKYINDGEKLEITCNEHGSFWQVANSHLCGSGCPLCPKRFSDPTAVYVMSSDLGASKVGVAIEPMYRTAVISRRTPFNASIYSFVVCCNYRDARAVESAIHRQIAHLNCGYKGFDGATEWFNIGPREAAALVKEMVAEMDAAV